MAERVRRGRGTHEKKNEVMQLRLPRLAAMASDAVIQRAVQRFKLTHDSFFSRVLGSACVQLPKHGELGK